MNLDRKTFLQGLGAGSLGLAAAVLRGAGQTDRTPSPPWPSRYDEADPERFWTEVRGQYAITDALAYLNTGGLGPSPRPVQDILDVTARGLQHRVETGHALFEEARAVIAGFLGAEADEVGFTRNATESNSIVAAGLGLKAGDEVVFESHAHPGGSLPWLNQARHRGVVVRTFRPDVPTAAGILERLAAQLTPRTRVIQVSHVTAPTGIVMPVAEMARLARERGAWFHIDGAQSAGMIPVDLRAAGCDSFATSGHKWLGGPRETGVLFIRKDRIEEVVPVHVGAYSSGDFDFDGRLNYTAGVRRHEYGTRNAAAVVALAEAARFQTVLGRERLAARAAMLARRVHDGLAALPGVTVLTPSSPDLRAAMTTFTVDGLDAARLFGRLLDEHGLRCRPVTEDGLEAVRVSTHIFNTIAECDRVVAAVAAITARR